MLPLILILAGLAAPAPAQAQTPKLAQPTPLQMRTPPRAQAETVDPAKVSHPDFVRNAGARHWRGLDVSRLTVTDDSVIWRLWRIANRARRAGPLWVVPHDNENAAFAAGLAAVRRWGGVMIAVDSGRDDTRDSARYVIANDGSAIDPNRSFTTDFPGYVAAALADLGNPARPVIALHTNAAGFDPRLSTCGTTDAQDGSGGSGSGSGSGSGGISILLCNDTYTPSPAADRRWPWDDDDSVVIAPYLATGQPGDGWCQHRLRRGNFNVTFEKVASGDGSLSNYAARYGLAYLNLETRDLGSDPAAIASARDRLMAMIAATLKRCPKPRTRLLAADGTGKEAR